MPRNGSGNYSKVNTFSAGATITASGQNQNWDDIASEMSNSVAADGQTTMTGQLKASNGTVAAPGVSFASDLDTGMYRIGGNNVGIACNGAKVLDVATTGLAVTGDVSATGALKQGGFSALLVGEIKLYAGTSIPSGFLACQGQSLLRASYPDLFAAIGTTYGAADGTHFSLPDLGGRAAAGKEASASRLTSGQSGISGSTLGAAGGSQVATLTTALIPDITSLNGAVSLSASVSSTNWVASNSNDSTAVNPGGSGSSAGTVAIGGGFSVSKIASTGTASGSVTVTSQSTGGSSPSHANVQPTIVLNYIIFAGV